MGGDRGMGTRHKGSGKCMGGGKREAGKLDTKGVGNWEKFAIHLFCTTTEEGVGTGSKMFEKWEV